ncbi:MAG: response regulator, partial [Bryobacterales bacterium]|nr:response regulator [Bryobacterales bacterium]
MPQRLLLVEDEIGIRVPLADSLRVAGYEVEAVEDGESALRTAPTGGFDLIVLDVLLPDKDGVAVCAELRHKAVNTPVLMLTVKAELEDRVRGFAAGADDYVCKPFEFVELLARIKAIVRRSQNPAPPDSS